MPPPPFVALQPGCPWMPRALAHLLTWSLAVPGVPGRRPSLRAAPKSMRPATSPAPTCSPAARPGLLSLHSGPFASWTPRGEGRASRAEGTGRKVRFRGEALPGGVARVSAWFWPGHAQPRRGAQRRGGSGSGPGRNLSGLHLPCCPGGREIGEARLGRGPAKRPRRGRQVVCGLGRSGMRERPPSPSAQSLKGCGGALARLALAPATSLAEPPALPPRRRYGVVVGVSSGQEARLGLLGRQTTGSPV